MRSQYILLPVILLFFQCKGPNYVLQEQNLQTGKIQQDQLITTKHISVDPGKIYVTKTDGTGKLYPVLQVGNGSAVIVVEVHKNLVKPMPDSGQTFKLYINTPNPLKLKGSKLIIEPQKTLAGILAFMEGAGYRHPKEGEIMIRKDNKGQLVLSVHFKENFLNQLNGTYPLMTSKQ